MCRSFTIPQEVEHLKMSSLLQPPTKEVDVDFLVFVERYATDLLKWDILTFFGYNPHFVGSTSQIAQHIGRSSPSLRPELGDLILLDILEQSRGDGQTLYQLTSEPHLRQMAVKLSNSQVSAPISDQIR
jgi:hypothetical protein